MTADNVIWLGIGIVISVLVMLLSQPKVPMFSRPIMAQCYSFNGETWDRLTNHGKSN